MTSSNIFLLYRLLGGDGKISTTMGLATLQSGSRDRVIYMNAAREAVDKPEQRTAAGVEGPCWWSRRRLSRLRALSSIL